MTATKYSYSINNDTLNGILNSVRLTDEIRSSDIVIAISHINTDGDDCDVWFKDSLSSGDQAILDSLVAAHTGEATPVTGPSYGLGGGMLISPTYSTFEDDEGFSGVLIQAAANTTTIVDFEITTEVNAAGGYFWSSGGNVGDYVDISVVDKNDILGLFSIYGLTVGVDVLELGKWVNKLYINPNGIPWASLIADDVAPVVAQLFLRAKYENTGVQDAVLGITYKLFSIGV
jgi:hypothetical protein